MEETRKIGDYSVKYSMYIGHKDIALGENPNADKNERYMCCFVETNAIFERYSGVLVSDDFAEIAKVFGQRVADAAEEIIQENERACQEVGINEELMAESCSPVSYKDSIENKVVVVKGSILRPEFRHGNHQLMHRLLTAWRNKSDWRHPFRISSNDLYCSQVNGRCCPQQERRISYYGGRTPS